MKTKNATRKIVFGKMFVDNLTKQKTKIKPQYKVKSLGIVNGKNVKLSFGVKQTVNN